MLVRCTPTMRELTGRGPRRCARLIDPDSHGEQSVLLQRVTITPRR